MTVKAIETDTAHGDAIDRCAHDGTGKKGESKLFNVLQTDQLNAIHPKLVQALSIPETFSIVTVNPSADALLLSLRELGQEVVILGRFAARDRCSRC